MKRSKDNSRKHARFIAWTLVLLALVAVCATFPAGWGAWCATRVARSLLADAGGTCEGVDWISPFAFEAHGFGFPDKPGDMRLERVEARYSPLMLIREKRVKALDATGFSIDVSEQLKPPADALFLDKTIRADARVRPADGEGMVVAVSGNAFDWPFRADAIVKIDMDDGFRLTGDGRAMLPRTPWSAHVAFEATTNGWEAAGEVAETAFGRETPVLSDIVSRIPMPGVTDLAFNGVVSAVASAGMTKAFPVPRWKAEASVGGFSASLSASGSPIEADGGRVKVAVSGIADHWDMVPSWPRIDTVRAAGFTLTNVYANLQMTESWLMVNRAGAKFCGGDVSVYSLWLRPETLDAGFTLFLDDIETGEFLSCLPDFHGSATGRLHGKVPLVIRHGEKVRFQNAFLYSTPGAVGKLKITDASPITESLSMTGAFSAADCDNIARVLADVDYDVLRLELTRDGQEDDTLSIRLDGTSTQGKETVPVNLSVAFHGAIERFVNQVVLPLALKKKK